MATQHQYEFFKLLYQEEADRYADLESRAKLYFTVISFYLGAIVLKFDDLQAFLTLTGVPVAVILAIAALMVVALVFCVMGIQIRNYEGIADASDVIDSFSAVSPTDHDFFDARIADFAVATARNSEENN